MSAVAVDIGGANLKASDGQRSGSLPFPLWKSPELLGDELKKVLADFHPYGPIVVTMTGELADCFETRRQGVEFILAEVQKSFPKRQIAVWQTGGEFFSVADAIEFPELVAAANWHALATWVGRATPHGNSLLIDVGSTTTDIIPIANGTPIPDGTIDLLRLQSGELVYSGYRRTPLFAMVSHVEIHGHSTPLAAELFATTLDIALLLREIPDDVHNFDTANGRPATFSESLTRVARMVCSDRGQLAEADILSMAHQLRLKQCEILASSICKVLDRLSEQPTTIIFSGEGELLARQVFEHSFPELLHSECLSLSQLLGEEHSQSACAYALAKLAYERL